VIPPEAPESTTARLLAGLNEAKREAVLHASGPLLVLAGAGSGKTRVITHRIAWLILHERVSPSRIFAVTFTNKAAGEMRERVEALLGSRIAGAWIGTFHAMCLRILRRDGERCGLAPGFNVYDTDDQLALVKRILKAETSEEEDTGTPRSFLSRISRAKNAMESPDDVERRAFTPEWRLLVTVYRAYQDALKKANAVDFDDILLKTLDLLRNDGEAGERYASRFEHLLVDEYQDTNRPQYLLVRALSSRHGNVCVVGDEDQSIYRFRGAELRNILEFSSDHPGARTIRLEQNYRSTATILEAAGTVVARNVQRLGKKLWTQNARGDAIELFRAPDDRSEAAWIAHRIQELQLDTAAEDVAVLYRTNAQSRLFEESFRSARIPYQVVGSVQFYARKEVKDVLAYLKLAANPADDVSFRRIVNTPARGIGARTLETVERAAAATGLPLMEAAGDVLQRGLLATRAAATLEGFLDLLADLMRRADGTPVPQLLAHIVRATQYFEYLEKAFPGMAAERKENVDSLISAAAEQAEETPGATLQDFLDRSALVADADDVGREPGVTLMTIHCAKGLEFPCVFLAGLEENLFPHVMSTGADEDIEEERRLCYVALTRARRRLFLTHARFRRVHGALLPNLPSRFLDEVPPEIVREVPPPADLFLAERPAPWGEDWGSAGSSAARAARRQPVRTAVRPTAAAEQHEDGLNVGAFVRHPRFGDGRILDREGAGKRLKLTIAFGSHGTKKILPAYTKLRVEA
jgi:DNA helicase-2/ATP-dependent DNA helicase PcrA